MCYLESHRSSYPSRGLIRCSMILILRHHYVRDMVEDGKIVICHIPSSDNLADVFTKLPLGRDAHRRACIGMRLILI